MYVVQFSINGGLNSLKKIYMQSRLLMAIPSQVSLGSPVPRRHWAFREHQMNEWILGNHFRNRMVATKTKSFLSISLRDRPETQERPAKQWLWMIPLAFKLRLASSRGSWQLSESSEFRSETSRRGNFLSLWALGMVLSDESKVEKFKCLLEKDGRFENRFT